MRMMHHGGGAVVELLIAVHRDWDMLRDVGSRLLDHVHVSFVVARQSLAHAFDASNNIPNQQTQNQKPNHDYENIAVVLLEPALFILGLIVLVLVESAVVHLCQHGLHQER